MALWRSRGVVVVLVCVAALALFGGAAQAGVISYWVNANTAGNQPHPGPLGMAFDVNIPITITQLGVFDDGSNGLTPPLGSLSAYLWNRNSTATPLATLSFTNGSPGTLVGGSRFKTLASPITLPAGFQGMIVADGYGTGEQDGNAMGATPTWTTASGSGAISFVGTSYWAMTPGTYPTSNDTNPANRYAAGTFVFAPGPITGGTAPGGFELTGTATGPRLWLKADAGVRDASNNPAADGVAVQTWLDQSGNANNASAPAAGNRPTYRTSSHTINGLPTVDFDAGRWLNGTSGFGANITATYFVIGSVSASAPAWDAIFTTQNSGSGNNGTGVAMNLILGSTGITVGGTLYAYPGSNPGLNTPFLAVDYDTANSQNNVYRVANFLNGSNNTLNGDLAEVLFFNRGLNSAERIIVSNALGAKYGIGLGADDHYAGDNPGNGDYDLDAFGIGRVNAQNVVAGAGAAGFGISEANDSLADGEWALAGHKTPTNSMLPNGRWDRTWYIDVTGGVDAVLTFDLSDGGVSLPPGQIKPMLLYAATPALSFQAIAGPGTLDGDQVQFALSGLQSGYYTLSMADIPEPATLSVLALGVLGLVARRRRTRR